MKKNVMMRLASFLLVAVLISTSAISGTYAKYVTQDSGADSARVAEWGVEVAITGTLFGDKYAKYVSESDGNTIIASGTASVDGQGVKVVAPGTKNEEGMTFKVTGIPEVSGVIDATVTDAKEIFLGEGNWGVLVVATGVNEASVMSEYYYEESTGVYTTANTYDSTKTYYEMHDKASVAATYYPIVWNGDGSVRLAAFATTLETAMNAEFTPNTDINNSNNRTINLKWNWPFSINAANDQADTILGNLFAGNNDAIVVVCTTNDDKYVPPVEATEADAGSYCLDVSFGASITVTQVD